jgi:hypothetical protein
MAPAGSGAGGIREQPGELAPPWMSRRRSSGRRRPDEQPGIRKSGNLGQASSSGAASLPGTGRHRDPQNQPARAVRSGQGAASNGAQVLRIRATHWIESGDLDQVSDGLPPARALPAVKQTAASGGAASSRP